MGKIFDVLPIDKIHRVGVDDSRVVVLALDLEVVGDEVDWSARDNLIVRLVGRVVEISTSAPTGDY